MRAAIRGAALGDVTARKHATTENVAINPLPIRIVKIFFMFLSPGYRRKFVSFPAETHGPPPGAPSGGAFARGCGLLAPAPAKVPAVAGGPAVPPKPQKIGVF